MSHKWLVEKAKNNGHYTGSVTLPLTMILKFNLVLVNEHTISAYLLKQKNAIYVLLKEINFTS